MNFTADTFDTFERRQRLVEWLRTLGGPMKRKDETMTPKQQRFVDEYLVDLNATQAAIRAGFSARTAGQAGSRLLKDVKIAAFIEKHRRNITARVEITQDWVLGRLKTEAELTSDDGGTHAGRIRATELLGRHIGMFADERDASTALAAIALVKRLIVDKAEPPMIEGRSVRLPEPTDA